LDVLLRFFRPVSLQNLLSSFEDTEGPMRDSFMLTFDDGLRECYDIIAPILKSYGVPATFFLCSAFVDNKDLAYDHKKSLLSRRMRDTGLSSNQKDEIDATLKRIGIVKPDLGAAVLHVDYCRRQVLDHIADVLEYGFAAYLRIVQPYLTSDQIVAILQLGHAIGAHSIDHPRYADVSLGEQLRQTRASVRFLKERFDLDYGAFSFPHSDANVSSEFFREMFVDGEVDVCFGNQGLLEDDLHRNIQRCSMEEPGKPAEAILGRGYVRRVFKKATGHLVVKRT
jgi:peptidoglycan/xylan/chitin deacetylase (PgdA/CDA1 family)